MTQPNQTPLNLLPIDLQIADVLALWKRDILLNFNCHHLATIQSFDAAKQTAKATINYKKTFYTSDANGNNIPVQIAYPILADCPVICLGGGTTSLTFPIVVGDECLVIFNDRDIDNWYLSGTNNTGILNTSRLHSFADGIILVGLRSLPNVLSNYNTTHAVLRNNSGAQVGVNSASDTVLIRNNSGTLNTLLQSLLTQLENLTTAIAAITVTGVQGGGGTSGIPSNAGTITGIGSNISTIASQIGGLLE